MPRERTHSTLTLAVILLALILGYLNGRGLLEAHDRERLPDVTKLLMTLSHDNTMRRCHIVVAERDRG